MAWARKYVAGDGSETFRAYYRDPDGRTRSAGTFPPPPAARQRAAGAEHHRREPDTCTLHGCGIAVSSGITNVETSWRMVSRFVT